MTERTAIAAEPPAFGVDAFPRDRFRVLVRHMPAYAKLALRLAKDRQLSKARRAAVVAAAAYLISPIDAIPGLIPIAGQLDDILLGMVAIRFALAGLRPEERARHLAAAGLSDTAIGEDLRHAAAISAWAARAGLRLGKRGVLAAATGARTAATAAAHGALASARRTASAAGALRRRIPPVARRRGSFLVETPDDRPADPCARAR